MKKLATFACALALALAMPTLAWAAPSPSEPQQTVPVADGITASVTFAGDVTVAATTTQASNVTVSGSEQVMGSIEVNGEGVSADNPLTVTFSVGSQYAGCTGKIFIQHNDGTTEIRDVTIGADGTASITVTKLSIFTLVVDTASVPAAGGTTGTTTGGTDASATSPQTGIDSTAIAGGMVVMAVAAGGVAVALRKKINE